MMRGPVSYTCSVRWRVPFSVREKEPTDCGDGKPAKWARAALVNSIGWNLIPGESWIDSFSSLFGLRIHSILSGINFWIKKWVKNVTYLCLLHPPFLLWAKHSCVTKNYTPLDMSEQNQWSSTHDQFTLFRSNPTLIVTDGTNGRRRPRDDAQETAFSTVSSQSRRRNAHISFRGANKIGIWAWRFSFQRTKE